MADVDPEALADVAYGIFEHLLNRGLLEQEKYLYALVEGGIDFKADLSGIFRKFREEYPQLADAMLARFSSIDIIYRMLCEGEGVHPLKNHSDVLDCAGRSRQRA